MNGFHSFLCRAIKEEKDELAKAERKSRKGREGCFLVGKYESYDEKKTVNLKTQPDA